MISFASQQALDDQGMTDRKGSKLAGRMPSVRSTPNYSSSPPHPKPSSHSPTNSCPIPLAGQTDRSDRLVMDPEGTTLPWSLRRLGGERPGALQGRCLIKNRLHYNNCENILLNIRRYLPNNSIDRSSLHLYIFADLNRQY